MLIPLFPGSPILYPGRFFNKNDNGLILSINSTKDKQSPCNKPVK